jgi:8-oxo-dGTP diphosphatase
MRPSLEVVAAVIVRGDAVLACRRRVGKSAAGLWEFPGGKVEGGEPPASALRREVREELAVDIEVSELLLRRATRVGETEIDLACYSCNLVGPLPVVSTDHDLMQWQPISQLSDLEWAAPDLPMVMLLEERN